MANPNLVGALLDPTPALEGRNPLFVKMAILMERANPGCYRAAWELLPFYSRWWHTLRGYQPGGRRGAPTIQEVEEGA